MLRISGLPKHSKRHSPNHTTTFLLRLVNAFYSALTHIHSPINISELGVQYLTQEYFGPPELQYAVLLPKLIFWHRCHHHMCHLLHVYPES